MHVATGQTGFPSVCLIMEQLPFCNNQLECPEGVGYILSRLTTGARSYRAAAVAKDPADSGSAR
jgi:hypothetical protein